MTTVIGGTGRLEGHVHQKGAVAGQLRFCALDPRFT